MYLKSVVLCVTFLFLEQSKSHILEQNVSHSNCQSICEAPGGQAEFDVETKLCKCLLLGKNVIDDIDAAVIQKNVKLINETQQSGEESTIIIKRDVSSETEPTPPETTTVITTTTAVNNEELNLDGIVGQHTPPRRLHHQQRIVTPRRHPQTRPITPEQQRLITQQIHDHLARLTQISDPRLREIEMEAIRANLRQLSQTHLIPIPQQRSRVRNIDDARRRLQRPRLPHSRLGAQLKETSTESEADTFQGKRRHFEIITQDPSLIDE